MKNFFEKEHFWLTLIILVSLLAVYPLLRRGFFSFHDEPQIANLYEMTRAILSGQIPPRWAPDMSFNFGYPLFNFYYPFPFYLGSIFNLVFSLSLIWSLKLVFLLSVPLSGIFFYKLSRKFFSPYISFASAAIYMFTPYRAVDLYVRGAVGELWSFVFMPLAMLSFYNLIKEGKKLNIVISMLALSGLILAHNLTAIVFLPFLLLFCAIYIFSEKEKLKVFFRTGLGFLGGFFLSAYYWLPAILEKRYIQPGTPFDPYVNFPFIKQLLIPSWGYGASVWGPYDGMSFQIGIINLLVIVIAVFVLFFKKNELEKPKKSLLIFSLFSFILSVFLMNIRSWFLWKIIPLGEYIQFPWRFLILTTFFSALAAGFLENLGKKSFLKFLPFFFVILAVIFTRNYFKPQNQTLVNDDYFLKRFFADRTSQGKSKEFSIQYLNYSEDYLPLTVWTQIRPSSIYAKKLEIKEGKLDYREISPINFSAKFSAEKPTEIIFHSYYFPGWEAKIDGKKIALLVNEPLGDISVNAPAGNHLISLKLKESTIRFAADILSLFSLIIIGFIGFWSFVSISKER